MARVFIDAFPHRPGGHCGSTAMRDILAFHGHEYTEEMVFGLGSGIDFIYVNNPTIEPPVYIGGRTQELEINVCARLGVGIEVLNGLGDREAWDVVREMLDGGTPVMVHADVYDLDYLRAKRRFGAHRVVLVGYDDSRGVAFVADNDRETVQECSLWSLAMARSSTHPPIPARNTYYRFEVPDALTPLESAIPPAIAEAVRHNTGSRAAEASLEFGPARISRGMAGLDRFVSDLPSFGESMSPVTLGLVCRHIYVSAEKGGTGYGGNFRRLYGRFLLESSGIRGLEALEAAGLEFIAIGDLWTELSTIFKDMSDDAARAVEKAHPVALEIARRERDAFAVLDPAAGGWTAG